MAITILDCYTDEPAGLGVPPFLGTYPRYIAGQLDERAYYITIDDLRLLKKYNLQPPHPKPHQKTDITVYNLTKNYPELPRILEETTELIVIVGVHTPGKYLTAMPGTIHELKRLLEGIRCRKVLTGPAVYGTQLHGGKRAEREESSLFDRIEHFDHSYETIRDAAVQGMYIVTQIPEERIIEIETGRGCSRSSGCSFCLEPLKNTLQCRPLQDIHKEIRTAHELGCRHFRLGKQSCIYTYPELPQLLSSIRELGDIRTLHIDNANPNNIVNDTDHAFTRAITRYCTPGNVAAFGVESFDPRVIEENNLNSDPETTMQAVRILNHYGSERGENGMPLYLPGINLLFGLIGETKLTFSRNYEALQSILQENLLLRRINIRQVVPFAGTPLSERAGNKYLRKNRRFYYGWRSRIRREIDYYMLQRLVPTGTVLHNVYPLVYDGKTTFCRQMGTYPLIVGVKERLPLKQPVSIEVTGYMLRSIIGRVV